MKGGEPQTFPYLADSFRFPPLGETIEVLISAIESANVSFDQSFSIKQTQRQKHVLLQFFLNKGLNARDWPVLLLSLCSIEELRSQCTCAKLLLMV